MTYSVASHDLPPCRYTEHTTVSLAQQWDQLGQMVMRMQHNLEQQIQARNTIGVSEEQLREFTASFKSVRLLLRPSHLLLRPSQSLVYFVYCERRENMLYGPEHSSLSPHSLELVSLSEGLNSLS